MGKKKQKEVQRTRFDRIEPYVDITVAIIAVASLVVSLKGCHDAGSANKIAQNALDASKHQFIQLNRPYVTLKPEQYNNGQYWRLSRRDESVVVAVHYEVKNIGNVAAKDIALPDKAQAGSKMKLKEGTSVMLNKPNPVTLGPGEGFQAEVIVEIGYDDPNIVDERMRLLASEDSTGLELALSLKYASELDSSQTYRTFVIHKFFPNIARLLKSEMIVLSEEGEE